MASEQVERAKAAAAAEKVDRLTREALETPRPSLTAAASAEAIIMQEDSWASRRARARRLGLICASPEQGKACIVERCPANQNGRCNLGQALLAAESYQPRGIPGQPDFDGDLVGR